jgi:hypothetical protein
MAFANAARPTPAGTVNGPRKDRAADLDAGYHLDPRYLFLVRAAARLQLVESYDMTLDEAINGLVDAMLFDFIGLCPCELATGRRQRFPDQWGCDVLAKARRAAV